MLHVAVATLLLPFARGACTPSETTFCSLLDPFASETGLFTFAGHGGPSPTITVRIGEPVVFDQTHPSNWFHPLGFAYEPDGAHGAVWGGDELPEIEGAGELQYLINGAPPTCADAAETGLDCYEPEFFYPRSVWREKEYSVVLNVTQAVADASNGGVIYYFCHIHSKMSGKIIILNPDGSPFSNGKPEKPLYSVPERSSFDVICGTTDSFMFADGGALECSERFLSGVIDTPFEKCMQAIDCRMNVHMRILGHDSHGSDITTFMQQMIPHHQNAVNMAKLVLRQVSSQAIECALDECSGSVGAEGGGGSEAGGVTTDGELANILWGIINSQNYQIHQFRNYLGSNSKYAAVQDPDGSNLTATSLGQHCSTDLSIGFIPESIYPTVSGRPVDGCTPNETTFCVSLDPFASETGYYMFAGFDGPSPTIHVRIGQAVTFDQRDVTNWLHPLGFAYEPDGAHGAVWGGDELPEIEGAGELQYLINGAPPTCADAAETGLDCYEPEFFYPRSVWREKEYSVVLNVTQAVADASNGGVIYYFCHIHSKMSGKIIILNPDGSPFSNGKAEKLLYAPSTVSPVDSTCGTSRLEPYANGNCNTCSERFLCGDLDTVFEKCLQAIDCQMNKDMRHETTPDSNDVVSVFMQQMIPHHQNAVNMAKLVLRHVSSQAIACALDDCSGTTSVGAEGGGGSEAGGVTTDGEFANILWDIINSQNYQIHQFRNYLGGHALLLEDEECKSSSDPLLDVALITIFAREFMEAGIIIGQHRLVILRSTEWQGEKQAQGLRAIWIAAAFAAFVAVLVIAAVTIPLAALSRNFDNTAAEVIEGVSKVIAAIAILQFSLKIPSWLGVYPKKKDAPEEALTLSQIRINVCWNVWREVAECGVFLIPFMLTGNDAVAIPLSGVTGLAIGLLVGFVIYVANAFTANRVTLAVTMAIITGWLSAGLFSGGMHEFEVVWGQSDVVFDFCTYTEEADDITLANAISGGPGGEGGENGGIIISGNTVKHICDGWNHGKFPMSLLRPFGYLHSVTVLHLASFLSFAFIVCAAHLIKYLRIKYMLASGACPPTKVSEAVPSDSNVEVVSAF